MIAQNSEPSVVASGCGVECCLIASGLNKDIQYHELLHRITKHQLKHEASTHIVSLVIVDGHVNSSSSKYEPSLSTRLIGSSVCAICGV